MERYVLDLEEIDQTQVALVGGKGAHLGELSWIEGIHVPPGFCVTTEAFRRIMEAAPPIDEWLDRLSHLNPDDPEAIHTLSMEVRRTVEGVEIPEDVSTAITSALTQSRRACRVRRSIERDGRGLADGLFRRSTGHVPERRRTVRDPPVCQPLLGLALYRAGRYLPPAQRHRPPEGRYGCGRAANGLPPGVGHPLYGRPGVLQPKDHGRGGLLRPR